MWIKTIASARFLGAAVCAMVLVLGCGVGGGPISGSPGGIPDGGASGPVPDELLVHAQVGPTGGDLEVADPESEYAGLKLTIPEGAVDYYYDFEIHRTTHPWEEGGLAFRLEPSGLVFAEPSLFRIPYDPTALGGISGEDAGALVVVVQSENGTADIVPVESIDPESHTLVAKIPHFSNAFLALSPSRFSLCDQTRAIDTEFTVHTVHRSLVPFVTGWADEPDLDDATYVFPKQPGESQPLGRGTINDFWNSPRAVLLVHGFLSNAGTFSNSGGLVDALDDTFSNIAIYQYRTGDPVSTSGEALADLIDARAGPNFRCCIIAHSMGGLVARYALERASIPIEERVIGLITLDTPHDGAIDARLAGNSIPCIGSIPDLMTGLEDPAVPPSTLYYLVAATGVGDIYVDVHSALGLAYVPDRRRAPFGTTHNRLHREAVTNGLGDRLLEWTHELSQPTGLTASIANDSDVLLAWDGVVYASAYRIYYAPGSDLSQADHSKTVEWESASFSGLTPGETYHFVVTAVNAGGESPASTAVSIRVPDIPAAPGNVTASGGDGAVTVEWDSVPNADSYTVYMSESESVSRTHYDASKTAGSPCTFDGLEEGMTYYFVVTAENDDGVSDESEVASATTNVTTGDLAITVLGGYDGAAGTMSKKSAGAEVHLFDADWNLVDDQTETDENGVAKWSDLTAGDYNFEVYKKNEPSGLPKWKEYWGIGKVTVNAGSSKSTTFKRYTPFAKEIVIQDKRTFDIIHPGDELPGNVVYAQAKIVRQSGTSQSVRAHFYLDRSASSSYDDDPLSSGTTANPVVESGELDTGDYFVALEIQTELSKGKWVTTDSWTWGDKEWFAVVPPAASVDLTVYGGWDGSSFTKTSKGVDVYLYDSNGKDIKAKRTTDASGVAAWKKLDPGTYKWRLEKSNSPSGLPSFTEFWGEGTFTIKDDEKAKPKAYRTMPAATQLQIWDTDGNSLSPGATISTSKADAKVWLTNNTGSAQTVRVRVIFDRDKGAPYDHDKKSTAGNYGSGATTVVESGTLAPGSYYCAIEVLTLVNGVYLTTDSWTWGGVEFKK